MLSEFIVCILIFFLFLFVLSIYSSPIHLYLTSCPELADLIVGLALPVGAGLGACLAGQEWKQGRGSFQATKQNKIGVNSSQ